MTTRMIGPLAYAAVLWQFVKYAEGLGLDTTVSRCAEHQFDHIDTEARWLAFCAAIEAFAHLLAVPLTVDGHGTKPAPVFFMWDTGHLCIGCGRSHPNCCGLCPETPEHLRGPKKAEPATPARPAERDASRARCPTCGLDAAWSDFFKVNIEESKRACPDSWHSGAGGAARTGAT